ncbi:MAG: hypothetical protein AB7I30_03610 [Isosphaeraceae bacterium]
MGHEPSDSPDVLLDRLRDHPEWDDRQREDFLGRLVERFPPDRVITAVRSRLGDLRGCDAESLLRLIEANPDPETLEVLAGCLERQPDLPPERAWAALAVLDGAGVLDRHPALVERWNDLVELIEEDDDPLSQLVEQIEGDPDGVWMALQGLGAIEAEIRPEIVAGLAEIPTGPGLVEFLRLLAYTPDEPTRSAALAVLERAEPDAPGIAEAWRDLASNHPDPALRREAARRSPETAIVRKAEGTMVKAGPHLVRSLVTAVEGRGRASIVLVARKEGGTVTAAFVCDVREGLVDVLGETSEDDAALTAFEELTRGLDRDCLLDRHELALALLAGCLWLGGPETPPSARYWVEATAAGMLDPRPLRSDFAAANVDAIPYEEMPARVIEILDACPDWVDDSPLTVELAEEISLREGPGTPDPSRDSGAYRFLFERRLKGQLERYQRMLLWMAEFWRVAGKERLALSARALAWQLSDAQHVVPGHPFAVALTTRSLLRALRKRSEGGSER